MKTRTMYGRKFERFGDDSWMWNGYVLHTEIRDGCREVHVLTPTGQQVLLDTIEEFVVEFPDPTETVDTVDKNEKVPWSVHDLRRLLDIERTARELVNNLSDGGVPGDREVLLDNLDELLNQTDDTK